LIAIGHSILKSVYHVLSRELAYKELGADHLQARQEAKRKAYLLKELEKLGYLTTLQIKELPPVQQLQPPEKKNKQGRCLLTPVTPT
jgi:hypothetical protein